MKKSISKTGDLFESRYSDAIRTSERPMLPGQRMSTKLVDVSVPFTQRLACTVADACEATGLGRTKLYELIGEGLLETAMIGRRRLVLVRSLLKLLG